MSAVPDRFTEFELLVDRLIDVHSLGEETISRKVDLLERLIEQWRIDRHVLTNDLDFEEFLIWRWSADDTGLHFGKSSMRPDYSAGTAPVRLQRKLLAFLLLNHGKYEHVLDIIRAFVRTIRLDLHVLDFKKTETGVFRCFTNTRFAANTLRDYGLLKFTKREAFKVWVLSLPGIIVAANALKEPGWALPNVGRPWRRLDPFTLQCGASVQGIPTLVATLSDLCGPNTEIFRTFSHVLEQAHVVLNRYWAVLENEDLMSKEQTAQIQKLNQRLETIIGYPDFIDELTSSIQIDNLLAKVEGASKSS